MTCKNFGTLTLEEITKYYDSTFKALARAKDIVENDGRIVGNELDNKKRLITLLEDTYPQIRSAKMYYDKGAFGYMKAELTVVHYRLQRIKELCASFPYRQNCDVEKVIIQERRRINALYAFVINDYPWCEDC